MRSLLVLCVAVLSALGAVDVRAESSTFTPPASYTGNIWVTIRVPADVSTTCFSVVWGPWIGSGCASRNAEGKFVLNFTKTKTDQVPFTVHYPSGSLIDNPHYRSTNPCPNVPPSGCKPVPLTWKAR